MSIYIDVAALDIKHVLSMESERMIPIINNKYPMN